MNESTKQCTKCKTVLPATFAHFGKHGSKVRPDCKNCRKAKAAAYYLDNKERILARNHEWAEANRDKIAAQSKRWAAEHPERVTAKKRAFLKANPHKNAEYMRRWRHKHREQYNAIDREYRAQNRARVRANAAKYRAADRPRFCAYAHNRRALERAGGTFTGHDIRAQYLTQQGRCFWCSCALEGLFHIDHVIPVSRGGSNTPENIVCACPPCNLQKSNRLPFSEWQPSNPFTGFKCASGKP